LGKLDVLCPNPKHKQQDPKRSHKIGQCIAVDIASFKPFAYKCFKYQKNITDDIINDILQACFKNQKNITDYIINDILQAYRALRYDEYQQSFKPSGSDTKSSVQSTFVPKSKSTYGNKQTMNYSGQIFYDMKPISRSRG
jgi:hypothetical protein